MKKKKGYQKRTQKAREEKKKKLNEDNLELRTSLKVRAKPGRPRIEEDQLLLLETIVDIAMSGSASHERRQSGKDCCAS